MNDQSLRVAAAARTLGIHPQTLRHWTDQGKIPARRMGTHQERRYAEADLRAFAASLYGEPEVTPVPPPRRAVLYVRVSGSTGQETSLVAQETELRALCARDGVEVAAVTKDKSSGLNERRVGLLRTLALVADGEANEVYVTHADRLARFGVDWLRSLLAAHGATLIIAHPKQITAPADELLADFMALVSSFAGRLYGQQSAVTRRQLLAAAAERVGA